MNRRHHWSLIELTIILVVLSILAAILAPVIEPYTDRARVVRVREDVQALGNVIHMFLADTGLPYFFQDGTPVGGEGNLPDMDTTNRVNLLVGDGDIPTVNPNAPVSAGRWDSVVNLADVDFLEYHLVSNRPGNDANNAYVTPSDLDNAGPNFAQDNYGGQNAEFAWRGPYITAPIIPDPWGNRYMVNVAFLDPEPDDDADGTDDTYGYPTDEFGELDVIVLCVGADEEVDTAFEGDGITSADDDIIYTVSAGAD